MSKKPRREILVIRDVVSEFLEAAEHRMASCPVHGLPDIGEGALTSKEEVFLGKSTFETLRE